MPITVATPIYHVRPGVASVAPNLSTILISRVQDITVSREWGGEITI